MTGTNHGMTGALIALLVREPALAVSLSFTSHFVCDAIPHSGMSPGEKLFSRKFTILLIADFLVAVTLMAILGVLFSEQRWMIWACMIAAASPDLMWGYYNLYIEKIKNGTPKLGLVSRFHSWIQWSQTPKGWIMEGVWFVSISAIILSIR